MVRLYQVDSFASTPFTGNPAGVCVLEKAAPESWMQKLAREMNLSETAFVFKDGKQYQLRWFSPTAEVPLCGHGTLATAHILWEQGMEPADSTLHFQTKSGTLTVVKKPDGIELNFPASEVVPGKMPSGLLEALGITQPPKFYGTKSEFTVAFLELPDESTVRKLKPDFGKVKAFDFRAVIVTAKADNGSDYDFVSRFFAPKGGVDEDPVTGTAHCALGPYWRKALKKDYLRALQVSPREGRLNIGFQADRVLLTGQAITVFEAKLNSGVDQRGGEHE